MFKRNNTNLIFTLILIAVTLFSLVTIYASSEAKENEKSRAALMGDGRLKAESLAYTKSITPSVSARAAILIEPSTGRVLFEKNADIRLPMASTTKIMTALVALECSSLDEEVTVPAEAVGTEGSSAYLREGDVYRMEELLYALLLQSANDAAVTIACHISGSTQDFASLMNEKADSLRLTDTCFANPHGLDSDKHYTTARELAKIAAVALENESFKEITSTYKKRFVSGERSRTYINHNRLLYMLDGAIGVKTGFTSKSGRCLVGAAERDGLRFITVTLDAPNDWNDHKELIELGFDRMERRVLAERGDFSYSVPVIDGTEDFVEVTNEEALSLVFERGDSEYESYVKLVKFVTAPVRRGEILGSVIFTQQGEEIARINLVATGDVKIREKTFFEKIFSIFKGEKQ
jgi:D-alanyl-D-alanine carboxypeptidase/D-alanyl-D-alanine carboxypeptidase (penicillin-binding protein 5/6)